MRADEQRAAAAEYRGRAALARPLAAPRPPGPPGRAPRRSPAAAPTRTPPESTGSSSGRPGRSSPTRPITSPSSPRNTWWRPGRFDFGPRAFITAVPARLDELVDAAQRRCVAGRRERRPDSEAVDAGAGREQVGDPVLVEVARADDPGLLEPAVVEHAAHLGGQAHQVARVDPHSLGHDAGLAGRLHSGVRPGERVVRVDQERRARGMVAHERDEGLDVGREREDVAVCHRPAGRHAVEIPRRDRRSRHAAADVRRPGREDAGVGSVCAPEAEVDHRPAGGGHHDPAGLGGDQRLEVDLVQEQGLGELARQEIALHPQDGLASVHDRALGNGRDLARELDGRQLGEQRRRADPGALEVLQRLLRRSATRSAPPAPARGRRRPDSRGVGGSSRAKSSNATGTASLPSAR